MLTNLVQLITTTTYKYKYKYNYKCGPIAEVDVPSAAPSNSPAPTLDLLLRDTTVFLDDAEDGDMFGYSLAMQEPFIVVGTKGIHNHTGATYIYNTEGSLLHTLTSPLTLTLTSNLTLTSTLTSNLTLTDLEFGCAVGISEDVIVVGAHRDNDDKGAAYLFNATTAELISTLTPSTLEESDDFGVAVAISENYVIVGAQGTNSFAGTTYVYDRLDLENPTQMTPDDLGNKTFFGCAVSVFDDILVVGAYRQIVGDNAPGAAYMYNLNSNSNSNSNSNPQTHIAKLEPTDGKEFDLYGLAVAVYEDTVAIGAFNNNAIGAVYVYNTLGAFITKLSDPNGKGGDRFGMHVDANDNFIVVRAAFNVFVYDRQDNISFLAKREAPGELGDVTVFDTTVVVGDRNANSIRIIS